MKKLLATIMIMAGISLSAYAAFPTNTSTKLVNIDKSVSDFNDFYFKWRGKDDQYARFTITNTANDINLTGYYGTFKAVARNSAGSNTVVILIRTNQMTVGTKTLSFSLSHTNIPWNGEHKAELMLVSASSNLFRTLARGKILVEQSLYQENDATYPYPSVTYLEQTAADLLYEKKGTNYATVTDGYVLTARTNATSYFTRWEAVSSSAGGTLTNVSVTGGLLTGGGGGASTSIGLTTGTVRGAIKAELNAGGLTGNVPVAVEQTIDHGNLLGLTDNDHPQYNDSSTLTGTLATAVQQSITALGTITQGVWQGTAIGDSYLTKTGDWTGTFDGQQGSYYLNAVNITNAPWLTAETDPIWGAVSNTVTTNAENGQAAYGWGNHALQGYKDFAQGTGTVPLVSLSGITSNQIDPTTDAAYRTGGGSGFPLTNDVNLAGYSMTNGNNITVTNAFSGKSLTLSGNATVSGGTITLNKTGENVVSAKPHAGNGVTLKLTDGDESVASWIDIGRNSLYGSFGTSTGIVFVAQKREGGGGNAAITFIAESLDYGDGATTNFSVSSAGAVRIGTTMNANNQAITNMKYSVTRTNATAIAPAAGTKAIYDIVISGTWYKREVINLGGTITTNLWKLN